MICVLRISIEAMYEHFGVTTYNSYDVMHTYNVNDLKIKIAHMHVPRYFRNDNFCTFCTF